MKLGKRQIEWLATLANPSMFLVVGDRVSDRLIALGLARPRGRNNSFVQITAAGWRALADAADAGRYAFPEPKPCSRSPRDAP